MKYVTLGEGTPHPLTVSECCLGTTFGEQADEATSFSIMSAALEAGCNFFDVAELYPVPPRAETYGASEVIVGKWLKEEPSRREKVVIASKVASRSPGARLAHIVGERKYPPGEQPPTVLEMSRQQVLAACDGSLERLGVRCIDLYQLHWPDRCSAIFDQRNYVRGKEFEGFVPFDETVGAVGELLAAGKIKQWGVSNENALGVAKLLEACARLGVQKPVTIQNDFSVLHRKFGEDATVEACGPVHSGLKPHGVLLLAYGALAGGTLSGKHMLGADGALQRARGLRLCERRCGCAVRAPCVHVHAGAGVLHGGHGAAGAGEAVLLHGAGTAPSAQPARPPPLRPTSVAHGAAAGGSGGGGGGGAVEGASGACIGCFDETLLRESLIPGARAVHPRRTLLRAVGLDNATAGRGAQQSAPAQPPPIAFYRPRAALDARAAARAEERRPVGGVYDLAQPPPLHYEATGVAAAPRSRARSAAPCAPSSAASAAAAAEAAARAHAHAAAVCGPSHPATALFAHAATAAQGSGAHAARAMDALSRRTSGAEALAVHARHTAALTPSLQPAWQDRPMLPTSRAALAQLSLDLEYMGTRDYAAEVLRESVLADYPEIRRTPRPAVVVGAASPAPRAAGPSAAPGLSPADRAASRRAVPAPHDGGSPSPAPSRSGRMLSLSARELNRLPHNTRYAHAHGGGAARRTAEQSAALRGRA